MRMVMVLAVVVGLVAASVAFSQENPNAGLQAPALVVEPKPTPEIAEGNTGLAAKYPGDVGIEKDPDVVFVEDFEGSVDEICSHWEDTRGRDIMSTSTEVPPGSGFRRPPRPTTASKPFGSGRLAPCSTSRSRESQALIAEKRISSCSMTSPKASIWSLGCGMVALPRKLPLSAFPA